MYTMVRTIMVPSRANFNLFFGLKAMVSASRSLSTFFLIFSLIMNCFCDNCKSNNKDMVLIKSHTDVKYFAFPTSDEAVMTWMDIQKGIYPNTSIINSPLRVGEPITIFIYLKDQSHLFDITVNDCWAYDNVDFGKSKNKLHLNEELFKKKHKIIDGWTKIEKPKSNILRTFLYTDLNSFKFPDKELVYVKCDIQLCFKKCKK